MKENRNKIIFISGRFPHVTETFTYNEVIGLKREGLNIQVYSFKKPDIRNLTSAMKDVINDTIYFPNILSYKIYLSQIYFLLHIPFKYFHTLLKIILGKYQNFNTLKLSLRSVANFLRGVHLSFLLKDRHKSIHVHAQFANNTATVGFICKTLLGISFSFRSHTSYNPLILKDKLKNASFVLSISEFDKRQLLHWSKINISDKIKIDYLGIDVGKWKKGKNSEENGLISSVGRLVEKKGFIYLIRAAEILNNRGLNFFIKIIGDGPLRDNLRDFIDERNLSKHIEILGYISRDEVKEIMNNSTIFCLPCIIASNGDVDGIPITCMEAMSLGKPVISADVSGIPELIDDGINGILVQQKDPTALANAIERLLKDAKLRGRLGKEARRKIERDFNLCKNIKNTANIFRENILR